MTVKFEFESKEVIDDNFFVIMRVDPYGPTMYQYRLQFNDNKNVVEYNGLTTNPISGLIKLRNIITATIDTLHDCVDITKAGMSQIEMSSEINIEKLFDDNFFNQESDDISTDIDEEDEDDEDQQV